MLFQMSHHTHKNSVKTPANPPAFAFFAMEEKRKEGGMVVGEGEGVLGVDGEGGLIQTDARKLNF